jgi:hypothetical protein
MQISSEEESDHDVYKQHTNDSMLGAGTEEKKQSIRNKDTIKES